MFPARFKPFCLKVAPDILKLPGTTPLISSKYILRLLVIFVYFSAQNYNSILKLIIWITLGQNSTQNIFAKFGKMPKNMRYAIDSNQYAPIYNLENKTYPNTSVLYI